MWLCNLANHRQTFPVIKEEDEPWRLLARVIIAQAFADIQTQARLLRHKKNVGAMRWREEAEFSSAPLPSYILRFFPETEYEWFDDLIYMSGLEVDFKELIRLACEERRDCRRKVGLIARSKYKTGTVYDYF